MNRLRRYGLVFVGQLIVALVVIAIALATRAATPAPDAIAPAVTAALSPVPLLRATATALPSPSATIQPPLLVTIQVASSASAVNSTDAMFTYLHAQAAGSGPRLLDSYVTTIYDDDGDTSWTYDDALVLMALLARATSEDLALARDLADAFVYAQAHDPQFSDGRLRDAYHAARFIDANGRAGVAQAGSATGNMAWATLALVRAWQRLGDEQYLQAAVRLGQWIVDHAGDSRGAGGYTGGLAAGDVPLLWKATEHNADVYAAFINLYLATNDPLWRERAMAAKSFLRAMWNDQEGFFWTGTTDDGATINSSPIPEDAQSWTLLVLGEPERYGRALHWAETELYSPAYPQCAAGGGYRFSDNGSGCWWEGTAHMALAWQVLGEPARVDSLLLSLRRSRLAMPDGAGEAIPAACSMPAVTGYGWDYPPQTPHIAATAWYLFAVLGHNPFWGAPVVESVPLAGIYDEPVKTEQPMIAPPPSGFQQGMSYAAWQRGDYATSQSDEALAELAATGAEWIALIVTGYQETIASTVIDWSQARTPSDADLTHAITRAHQLGLKVMLKPHVDLSNDPGHWRGQIGTGFTEQQWQAWFASYSAFIGDYADLAAGASVEQFCVGTELETASQREADWRALIADLRRRFAGPLLYAANHSGEEMHVSWWDALDDIGVDAYYPLTADPAAKPADLALAWSHIAAQLQGLSARVGKPVVLTEIGYRSIAGANTRPWDWQALSLVDLQRQADCYQAALSTLWGQPWLAGIYWWSWDANPAQGGPHDPGYSPHGKPAETVLKQYYRRGG